MKTLNLAVIGKDVSKSDSPRIHNFIAEKMGNSINYTKVSIPERQFSESVQSLFSQYDGFNVTIPYKLTVIDYLNSVNGDACIFGAVNTVRTDDKSGYNTDGEGFALMLKNNSVNVNGKSVLLLGAGGAGRSVAKKLSDAGAQVEIYDAREGSAKAVAEEFKCTALEEITVKPYYLIVNATGVGMHKTEGISPVGEELINLCKVTADLIYVPEKSKFLEIAEKCGKKIINGSAMLFYQAYYSECIYFGVQPDEMQAKKLFEQFKELNI